MTDEFTYEPNAGDMHVLGAVRGIEQVIRKAEALDGEAYDLELEEGRDCLMCEGKGYMPVDSSWREGDRVHLCEHCHGRGWLKATSFEPQPLFSVREMAWGTGSAFGIRHDESGFWHWLRFGRRDRAEEVRDMLLCAWCEGEEAILVKNFQRLEDEERIAAQGPPKGGA